MNPEAMTWQEWRDEARIDATPGWAFCRFAMRTGPNEAKLVLGIVRGDFGIWRSWFDIRGGVPAQKKLLACVTHLPSGMGLGIFDNKALAVSACDLAAMMHDEWSAVDPDDIGALAHVVSRVTASWKFNGISIDNGAFAIGPDAETAFRIWNFDPAVMLAGKPSTLS